MTKTQIQVPDDLFAEVRKFARQRGWSLAETFRRGAELLLRTYPADATPPSAGGKPPTARSGGGADLRAAELHGLNLDDQSRFP